MDTFSAAVMLFLIMDPMGNLPVFTSILKHVEKKRRRIILIRELLIALSIMMAFLFMGEQILNFLSLKKEAVSISGAIILFLIGLKMIFPPEGGLGASLGAGDEPLIVPLAIPSLFPTFSQTRSSPFFLILDYLFFRQCFKRAALHACICICIQAFLCARVHLP